MPEQARNLDVIAVREFLWAERNVGAELDSRPYEAIDDAIKTNDYLIIALNETEQKKERELPVYERFITSEMPAFKKIYDNFDLMVYQKRKA